MLRNLAVIFLLLMALPTVAWAGGPVQVRGYTRKDGTYVSPHTRSSPGSGLGSVQSPAFVPPPVVHRTEYRTTPRKAAPTVARTGYQSSLARSETPQRRLIDEQNHSDPERLTSVQIDVTTMDDDKEEGVFAVELFQGTASIFRHEYGDGQKWRDNTRKSFTETINVPVNDDAIRLVTNLEIKSTQRKMTWVAKVQVTVATDRTRRLEWFGGAKFEVDPDSPSYSFQMGTKHLPKE